jgi:hypothetical protein
MARSTTWPRVTFASFASTFNSQQVRLRALRAHTRLAGTRRAAHPHDQRVRKPGRFGVRGRRGRQCIPRQTVFRCSNSGIASSHFSVRRIGTRRPCASCNRWPQWPDARRELAPGATASSRRETVRRFPSTRARKCMASQRVVHHCGKTRRTRRRALHLKPLHSSCVNAGRSTPRDRRWAADDRCGLGALT